MLLKKKSFIILFVVVFVLLPILLLIFDLFNAAIDTERGSLVRYLKTHFLPFYDFLSDSISVPGKLHRFFYATKISNYFSYFFIPFLSIIGILRFQKTGSLRILQGLLIIVFFYKIHSLISISLILITIPEYKPSYIYILITLISVLASIFSLNYIRTKLSITIVSDTERPVNQEVSVRFLNMIIDQVVITYLAFVSYDWFSAFTGAYREDSDFSFIIYFQINYSLQFVLYYFLIEGCFKTTVGKAITNSSIVNSEGQFISIGNAFVRTLCRYIPFEPFSFLIGKRGWHDTVSDTYVVKSFYKNDE